jgi:hypothetical protein
MEKIINKAEEFALSEIEKYGTPKMEHFRLSIKKGQELAEKLEAEKDIVMLGTILMDLKLGECLKENKLTEHVGRSSKASGEFLEQFDLSEEVKNKIISCVEEHHGVEKFSCKESEICANADCYRFIHPRGVLAYLTLLGKRYDDFEDCLTQLTKKMEEKYNILSIDICKEELESDYKIIKELIKKAGGEI